MKHPARHAPRTAVLALLAGLAAPACSIPGDAAWSDLHLNAYAAAFPVNVDAEGRNIQVDDTSGTGFTFDGDLTVEPNRASSFLIGARAGFAPFELVVSEFGYDGTHDGVVSGGATFNGVVIPAAADLDSRLDLDMSLTKLLVGVDVLNTPVARVGVLAGVDFFQFDRFSITAREAVIAGGGGGGTIAIGDTEDILINEDAPVPVIGLRGDLRLPYGVRLGGELTGMNADISDVDLSFVDLDLNANWSPWTNVEAVVGYRMISADLDGTIDGTALDVTLDADGPYVGVAFFF